MKRLIIESLIIISKTEKKARKINFDPQLTIIKSEREDGTSLNRTGKSLVLKSIYYAFGAELSKYTTTWSNLSIETIIKFKLNSTQYTIYRSGNSFVISNENGESKNFYKISELNEFYYDLFDFNIKLKNNKINKLSKLYPGGIFLPFYIDQDIGWQGEWRSFKDISFYKDWKKEILLFHMGIKPKRYYELLEEQVILEETNKNYKVKYKTLDSIYDEQISRNSDVIDINVKLEDFKIEIDLLTNALNKHLELKSKIKDDLVKLYNEKFETEENYRNAIIVLNGIEEDIKYINESVKDETIICPTCGVLHENSIANRFVMYQEVEKCRTIIQNFLERKESLQNSISSKESHIGDLSNQIDEINEILNKKRNEITFDEVIKSKGAYEIIKSLNADLVDLKEKIEGIEGKLKALSTEKGNITKQGKGIRDEFNTLLKQYITILGVGDVDTTKKKSIGKGSKSGGSDLSRAVLAELYALYNIIQKNSTTVICPIIFDTPLQQEQGSENIEKILELVLDKQPKNSQVIIGITETHGKDINGKVINLLEERGLLKKEDYINCKDEIERNIKLLINI